MLCGWSAAIAFVPSRGMRPSMIAGVAFVVES